jgi:hypothetical protein
MNPALKCRAIVSCPCGTLRAGAFYPECRRDACATFRNPFARGYSNRRNPSPSVASHQKVFFRRGIAECAVWHRGLNGPESRVTPHNAAYFLRWQLKWDLSDPKDGRDEKYTPDGCAGPLSSAFVRLRPLKTAWGMGGGGKKRQAPSSQAPEKLQNPSRKWSAGPLKSALVRISPHLPAFQIGAGESFAVGEARN